MQFANLILSTFEHSRFGAMSIAIRRTLTGILLTVPLHVHAQTVCGDSDSAAGCRFERGPLQLDTEPVQLTGVPQPFFAIKRGIDFLDSAEQRWSVPVDTLTDGASIPEVFIPLIGERDAEEYLQAAAVHDAYCGHGNHELAEYHSRHWEDVHRMFYDAMIVNGVSPFKARIMYAAVYLGGPRWEDPERSLEDVPEQLLIQEMEWCLHWLRNASPSPERIREWMLSREANLRAGTPEAPDFEKLFAEEK